MQTVGGGGDGNENSEQLNPINKYLFHISHSWQVLYHYTCAKSQLWFSCPPLLYRIRCGGVDPLRLIVWIYKCSIKAPKIYSKNKNVEFKCQRTIKWTLYGSLNTCQSLFIYPNAILPHPSDISLAHLHHIKSMGLTNQPTWFIWDNCHIKAYFNRPFRIIVSISTPQVQWHPHSYFISFTCRSYVQTIPRTANPLPIRGIKNESGQLIRAPPAPKLV